MNQSGQHAQLHKRFADSLREFQQQLKRDGTAGRVTTMVFSEFGRRVAENGGGGTDHGTAAPMFIMGPHVRAGFHGTLPSLTNLDRGDLRHGVDFRQVYAAVLSGWLTTDPQPILLDAFEPLPIIKA